MRISVTKAKGRLAELIRRAEAGQEISLTRHGRAVAEIVPVPRRLDAAARQAVIARIQASAARKRTAGVSAARSQDFLYDDCGMPD